MNIHKNFNMTLVTQQISVALSLMQKVDE